MARPRKRTYDPDKVMQELLNTVVFLYCDVSPHPSLASIADELWLNALKIRKLLITAGVYESETANEVAELRGDGRAVEEVMALTGLSKASVHSYLPYSICKVYKGISYRRERSKFRAYISVNDKYVHLGHFDTDVEAARAYDEIDCVLALQDEQEPEIAQGLEKMHKMDLERIVQTAEYDF